MLPIQQKHIQYNFSNQKFKVDYIVVHDTANRNVGADAEAHYRYFNGGNRNSSAHFFVDKDSILELVPVTKVAWHCGDGRGAYGITNFNSIGIEICVNADDDYNKTRANTIDLVRYLMNEFNVPIERVVRHYDASRKICPANMSANNWVEWHRFKEDLIVAIPTPSTSAIRNSDIEGVAYCTVKSLNVRDGAGTNYGISGELNSNEKVTVLEKSGDWRKVRYYNAPKGITTMGWVNANYLRIDKDVSLSAEYGIVTATELNVRAGRGTSYDKWDTLKSGAKVELGELRDGWYLVYYNGGKASGYVSAKYIKKD